MPNLEYENFYKFLVSLGVGIISFAVLATWLFLREPFDLQVANINDLTPLAQTIVQGRQAIAGLLLIVVPLGSCCLVGIGAVMIAVGGILWWQKIQNPQDMILASDLKQKLTDVSKSEEKDKLKAEAIEELQQKQTEKMSSSPEFSSQIDLQVNKAQEIEQHIFDIFRSCFGLSHEVLVNQRAGDIYYDLLLVSKERFTKSYTVEIKYTTTRISYSWLRDNALRLIHKNRIIQAEINQIPNVVLLIITNQPKPTDENTYLWLHKIEEEKIFRKGKGRLIFFTEDELNDLTCERIRMLI